LLNQNYYNFEILILDNNSRDHTQQVLKKYQNAYNHVNVFFSEHNRGPYEGLNFLLDKAKGEYVAITDHDDIYHPTKLEKQIKFLVKNNEFIGCGTNLYKYYESNNTVRHIKIKKQGTFAAHPSLVFKNHPEFRYNTKIKYKTDTYFMKYILCNNKPRIYNLTEPLYLSRVRNDKNNLSYLWNKNLTFGDVWNYYKYSQDSISLIKFLLKKIFNYNFFNNVFDLIGRKKIEDLKSNKFFQPYLYYLKK
jgi:glycosyltransferase involved in cell wall biosynthesis